MTSTVQMMTKQPLIVIIWIYQEMMVWMSRKSICSLHSRMEDFGSEVVMRAAYEAIFDQTPQPQIQPTMTSMGQMMTKQPLIIII
jgi:hypothetical protein